MKEKRLNRLFSLEAAKMLQLSRAMLIPILILSNANSKQGSFTFYVDVILDII